MAKEILAMERTIQSKPQYHLPEEHRQEILAQSASGQLRREIERQRVAFAHLHGDSFGLGPMPLRTPTK